MGCSLLENKHLCQFFFSLSKKERKKSEIILRTEHLAPTLLTKKEERRGERERVERE